VCGGLHQAGDDEASGAADLLSGSACAARPHVGDVASLYGDVRYAACPRADDGRIADDEVVQVRSGRAVYPGVARRARPGGTVTGVS
jgi:hypothetical protein